MGMSWDSHTTEERRKQTNELQSIVRPIIKRTVNYLQEELILFPESNEG
jgi:hypothetical protein